MGSRMTHFRFAGIFLTATLMTLATRSHFLCDNAAITVRRRLDETLPAQPACRRDPQARSERLDYDVLQEALLTSGVERR